MAYYQRVGTVTRDLSETEYTFHMYLIANGEGHPGANEKGVIPPLATALLNPEMFFTLIMFGRAIAGDYEIRDGLDPATSSIVARGRGFLMGDSMTSHGYFSNFDILFTDERFKGSTLKVMGSFENVNEDGTDHLAIIGGTGEFAYAQGTIGYKPIKLTAPQIIRELNIRVFCRNVPAPPAPLDNKEGPLGGKGGTAFDIPAGALPPQRIDSITIRSDGAINSFAYSYTDNAGNKQTSGPWGGTGGNLQKTIDFPPSETLKKVLGTTAVFDEITVVTSLTFVTSKGNIYGPYGKGTGTSFSIPEMNTNEVVGFFGRSGKYLDALGVYTSPSAPTN